MLYNTYRPKNTKTFYKNLHMLIIIRNFAAPLLGIVHKEQNIN